jgi:hypothetical protein
MPRPSPCIYADASVCDSRLPGEIKDQGRLLELDVRNRGGYTEVLECGEILPRLLDDAGLPSSSCSGLALGMGLDRLVMLRKGLDDIRLLRSTDPRIADQMTSALVCVTIRDPARSIPSEEANALARQVYRALHQGSRGYL